MAVNWSLGLNPNPLKGIQAGSDYVTQIMDQAARLKAGQAYAGGDYQGAASALAGRGDIKGAAGVQSQGASLTAGKQFAGGDYTGAAGTLAKAGDLEGATKVQNFGVQQFQAQQAYAQQAIPVIQAALQKGGAGEALNAYKQLEPDLKAHGVTDQTIAQVEQGLASDPQGTIQRLGAFAQHKFTYQSLNDGSVLQLDENGQVVQKFDGGAKAPPGYTTGQDGALTFIPGGPADPDVIKRNAEGRREVIINNPMPSQGGGPQVSAGDPVVQSWVGNVINGNATMTNVPAKYRNAVSEALQDHGSDAYSPLASTRFANASNRIATNFVKLPQYQLTANGLPYLQRIEAAMQTPGSVSDQDLLDSLTKLNTAGNAITDAQVRLITDGKSYSDWAGTVANKFLNGGVLSDSQRKQIKEIANNIYANYRKGYQPVYDQATKQLKAAGIPEAFWTIPDLNKLNADQSTIGGAPAPEGAPQTSAAPKVRTYNPATGKLE